MNIFFDNIDLNINQVQVIVRGMCAVAKSDGLHQSELVMMREFYDGCQRDTGSLADFNDLLNSDFNLEQASDSLHNDALKATFLKSCILLAYADGAISDEEKKVIGDFAKTLGVDDDLLAACYDAVKDQLFQQIARIQNMDALQEVMKELN